jgi:hypothetical protein
MQTGPGSGIDGSGPGARNVNVRRLWLPWRPRMRLILLYPRCWHYVCVWLERFDLWLSGRYTGAARRIAMSLALLPFVAVRFIGLVAVLEITIITFTISIYLVWGEWMLLLLLFPFTLLARLVGALPWTLIARMGEQRWTAQVSGWQASGEAVADAAAAVSAGTPAWASELRASWIWM